ncbi:MAG: outer membrane beta-barrel protein [Flavipsychrobacter sp.]|nr:outer membrane beta-barrel protein [Flavipsychrobacter sp.]
MKNILLIILAAGVAAVAHAQVALGPEIGINISNIKLNKEYQTGEHGFRGGGILDIRLGKNSIVYFQTGAFSSVEGAGFGYGTNSGKLVIDYLQVPANLVFKFWTVGDNHFFAGVGPYTGLVVGGTATENGDTRKIITGRNTSKDDVRPNDIGLGFQAGYQFAFGLFFHAQYGFSIMNIAPDENSYGANNQINAKNSVFSYSAGWLFDNIHFNKRRKAYYEKKGW